MRSERPMILVVYSSGCLAPLYWAVQIKEAVVAVLLVAPVDLDKFSVRGLPLGRVLSFPTALIVSRNDPWMPQGSTIDWIARQGTEFTNTGETNHIDVGSNLGSWNNGLAVLDRLIGRTSVQGTIRDGTDQQAQWDVLLSIPYI